MTFSAGLFDAGLFDAGLFDTGRLGVHEALQAAIVGRLRADADFALLLADHAYESGSPSVAGVYEYVPQSEAPESVAPFPYVVVGDTTVVEWDTDDVNGHEHTVVIHVWDRHRGRRRVRQIQDAIYAALHGASFTVAGHALIYCYWEFSDILSEEDPVSQHAVTRFRIVTQEL